MLSKYLFINFQGTVTFHKQFPETNETLPFKVLHRTTPEYHQIVFQNNLTKRYQETVKMYIFGTTHVTHTN